MVLRHVWAIEANWHVHQLRTGTTTLPTLIDMLRFEEVAWTRTVAASTADVVPVNILWVRCE